jgi:hypothetical protein
VTEIESKGRPIRCDSLLGTATHPLQHRTAPRSCGNVLGKPTCFTGNCERRFSAGALCARGSRKRCVLRRLCSGCRRANIRVSRYMAACAMDATGRWSVVRRSVSSLLFGRTLRSFGLSPDATVPLLEKLSLLQRIADISLSCHCHCHCDTTPKTLTQRHRHDFRTPYTASKV